ncbi:hypothetical protein HYU95_01370 [Candidatus Daviesbacteria bacterium]|nr:hypothetical protein [Candidatus Daviesbacteria bacterium]
MVDIEKVRGRLDGRQKQDLAVLEAAGAKLQRAFVTTAPSLEYWFAFPKSSLGEKEILSLTEELDHESGALVPARWSVRSSLDNSFSQESDPEYVRLKLSPLLTTIYSLHIFGFRTREKVETTGERSLVVQFPGFDRDSKFHPNLILQATAEGHPKGWQVLPETKTPEIQAQESFTAAISRYQEFVAKIGNVQACLVGKKPGFRTGYIWNVLAEDFTLRQIQQDQRFVELSEVAAEVIADSKDHMPMRIANVLPANTGKLIRRYERNGHELTIGWVDDEEKSFDSVDAKTTRRQTNLDILIGGLQSYSARLQQAREIAERVRKEDFSEGFEEAFRLDSFGKRIKEKRAGTVLIDIALARNAAIKSGFARGFEMMAEPVRVIEALVEDIFNDKVVASITELDIHDAVEAGSLVCHFSS